MKSRDPLLFVVVILIALLQLADPVGADQSQRTSPTMILIAPSISNGSTNQSEGHCTNDQHCLDYSQYVAHSPLIPCNRVPLEFVKCDEPLDLKGNESARIDLGFGCTKFGGQRHEDVQFTSVNCTVLSGIECYGDHTFVRENVPCIKYTGHYFVTTLLYSILLGFLGMDRFCLGHTGTAVGKLLTLGGVGIWWLVDIVLLVTGHLMPEDGSNWMPTA